VIFLHFKIKTLNWGTHTRKHAHLTIGRIFFPFPNLLLRDLYGFSSSQCQQRPETFQGLAAYFIGLPFLAGSILRGMARQAPDWLMDRASILQEWPVDTNWSCIIHERKPQTHLLLIFGLW
jgi:hypothetical protein